MSKTIKIIFTISLIINLALIGVVMGGAYKRYSHYNYSMPDDLSPVVGQKIRDSMERSRDEIKEHFQKIREDRMALKNVIEAENFDKGAYDAEIEKMLNSKSQMERMRAQKMGEMLSGLSQEDRQKMSKHFLRSLSGKGSSGKHSEHKKFNRDDGDKANNYRRDKNYE